MKSISLKIGICLAIIYTTGWLYLPMRAKIYLYGFDQSSWMIRDLDASQYAKSKCLADETVDGRNLNRCWDQARAEFLTKN